MRLYN